MSQRVRGDPGNVGDLCRLFHDRPRALPGQSATSGVEKNCGT